MLKSNRTLLWVEGAYHILQICLVLFGLFKANYHMRNMSFGAQQNLMSNFPSLPFPLVAFGGQQSHMNIIESQHPKPNMT